MQEEYSITKKCCILLLFFYSPASVWKHDSAVLTQPHILDTTHYKLPLTHCTLNTANCTLHTAQCALCTVLCCLHSRPSASAESTPPQGKCWTVQAGHQRPTYNKLPIHRYSYVTDLLMLIFWHGQNIRFCIRTCAKTERQKCPSKLVNGTLRSWENQRSIVDIFNALLLPHWLSLWLVKQKKYSWSKAKYRANLIKFMPV